MVQQGHICFFAFNNAEVMTAAGFGAFFSFGKVGRHRAGVGVRAMLLLICSDLCSPEPWGSRDALSLALSSPSERSRGILTPSIPLKAIDPGQRAGCWQD